MNTYQRIFGSGPHGLGLCYLLLLALERLVPRPSWPPIFASEFVVLTIAISLLVAGLALILWSVVSLPPEDRGSKLITTGAFRLVRHPLYAGVISFINFGLAAYLNHWLFVLWALAAHPIMHWAIRYEEQLMLRAFPKEYPAYCSTTGRFVPRFGFLKKA